MNIDIIKRFFNNKCTEEELSSVLEWFEGSAQTPKGEALLFKIWEELPDEEENFETNFNLILDKIHHRVNLARSKKLLEISDQDIRRYNRRQYFKTILKNAAAILLLPVFSFGLYMSFKYQSVKLGQASVNQTYNEIFSSVDAITKVTLADGSKVWLNHSSSLKYPEIFQGNTRTVELNGEGYFEIIHNSKIPFIVKAGEIQIKATGTTFNIMAYPDEDRIETSLIIGGVELQKEEPGGSVITLLEMKPTDLSIFQKVEKKITTLRIDDDRYYSWKEGKLVFNSEPMGEVVKKLSRWFNVDIQIKDPELLKLTYTATFVNETLPQVMELITLMSPVNYSISNRKEIGTGIYTKTLVILSYRNK